MRKRVNYFECVVAILSTVFVIIYAYFESTFWFRFFVVGWILVFIIGFTDLAIRRRRKLVKLQRAASQSGEGVSASPEKQD